MFPTDHRKKCEKAAIGELTSEKFMPADESDYELV